MLQCENRRNRKMKLVSNGSSASIYGFHRNIYSNSLHAYCIQFICFICFVCALIAHSIRPYAHTHRATHGRVVCVRKRCCCLSLPPPVPLWRTVAYALTQVNKSRAHFTRAFICLQHIGT